MPLIQYIKPGIPDGVPYLDGFFSLLAAENGRHDRGFSHTILVDHFNIFVFAVGHFQEMRQYFLAGKGHHF